MQLTSFTDYALRVLMFLAAHPEKLSSVKEISQHYGISRNHLVKVVHRLAQLGLVETSRGKGGGIRLACPHETRLGDIVRQIEDMGIVECFDREKGTCRITDHCQLKHYLFEASEASIAALNKYSLADTVRNEELFAFIKNAAR